MEKDIQQTPQAIGASAASRSLLATLRSSVASASEPASSVMPRQSLSTQSFQPRENPRLGNMESIWKVRERKREKKREREGEGEGERESIWGKYWKFIAILTLHCQGSILSDVGETTLFQVHCKTGTAAAQDPFIVYICVERFLNALLGKSNL